MKFRKTEMPCLQKIILAIAICASLATAGAHHSNAMFDKAVVREVTVTVKEFQWTNPHIWIQVLLENEDGEEEEWSIEGGGPNTLFRKGWRPNTFKPGDVVEMKFNPMHDGSNAGLFIGARFASGETLGNW
jgi:hypothetical protein